MCYIYSLGSHGEEGFSGGIEFIYQADVGSIPGSGRFPREGNGNPLQYSCQGNLTDRGAWQATVHGVAKKSDTAKQLNNNNS